MIKRIAISLVCVVVVGVLIMIYLRTSVNYAAQVHTEVAQVAQELLLLEQTIETDTLSPGVATIARAKLITHLDVIENTVSLSHLSGESVRDIARLEAELEMLERLLEQHRSALQHMDEVTHREYQSDTILTATVDEVEHTIAMLQQHIRSQEEVVAGVVASKSLNLSFNQLQEIPRFVYLETDTQELILSHNRIRSPLSSDIGTLSQLVILNLSDNQLTEIPDALTDLTQLQVLDLSHNNISTLPPAIHNFSELKLLRLTGNPIQAAELETIKAQVSSTTVVVF